MLNVLRGDNQQGKVACKTTTFGWVMSAVLFSQPDCRILKLNLENITFDQENKIFQNSYMIWSLF